MALPRAFLPIYTEYLTSLKFESPLAMLGNQVARFNEADLAKVLRGIGGRMPIRTSQRMSMADYMAVFGIEEYVDIDLYGTPKLRLDLSTPIPEGLRGIFRTVADIGTLEHIINPWQALINIAEMLVLGGKVFHMSPCKISLNHGYYTISPQLLFDFYAANGFRILRSDLLSYFGPYDSPFCLVLVTNYLEDRWLLHKPGQGLPTIVRVMRLLRRLIADYANGTLILFAAAKFSEVSEYRRTVQAQWVS